MENLVSNITNIIFGGFNNFAQGIGNAFSNFAENIFLKEVINSEFDYSLAVFSGQNPYTLTEDVDLNIIYPGFDDFLDTYNFTYSYNGSNSTVVPSGTIFYGNTDGIARFSVGAFDSSYNVVSVAALEYFGDDSMIGNSQNAYLSIFYSTTTGATISNVGILNISRSYELNTFGFVTIAFTSLGLMFGLSRWVLNIITSLGKRNK